MSQVTIYFGVAPAIAPIIGGFLFVHAGLARIFWFLTAVGVVLFDGQLQAAAGDAACDAPQPFNVRNLMRGYWQLGSDPRFLLLALASGVPFNGMFLYVLSAPAFLGDHLAAGAHAVLLVLPAHHRRHHAGSFASGRWPARSSPSSRSATASS
jgi:DHA1 family bicyclomycin/chloramphenicol resistance-like MFS transporter